MENRIYAPKQSKSIFIVGIVFFIFLIILSVFIVASTFSSEDIVASIVLSFILFSFSISMLICCFVIMNRECSKMWYDTGSKEICREGHIKGFEHTVKLENIKDIIIIPIYRAGLYFQFVEEENENYSKMSKKYPIRLQLTDKSIEFIKAFWDKPITHKLDSHGNVLDITDYDKRLYGL